ncbi:MAG: cytochrome c3 family protein [Planctomycetota bacterium]|jgi:predicted CXXCH cytochrome family protein
MKRTAMIASVGVVAAGSIALVTMGDIVGSVHDFSNSSWAGGEICKPCHTPHFAMDIGFLWAHTLSTQAYTLYDGTTSSPGGVDELDQFSRMCLSCHDGTIALNDFHNGGGTPIFISDANKVGGGGDLSDDHPIGITAEYPITGSSQFNAPVQTPSGFWGFGGTFFPEVPLFEFNTEQVVSCSTCHTPHAVAGIDNLLRKINDASDLCLTCHIK